MEPTCPKCRTVFIDLRLEHDGVYELFCPGCRYYSEVDLCDGRAEYRELSGSAFVRRVARYRDRPSEVRLLNPGTRETDAQSIRFAYLEIDERSVGEDDEGDR